MRGQADDQLPLFHLFNVEDRIRPDHPLRDIKRRVDRILAGMSSQFAKAYSAVGRPSVPPERLLKALLLLALYSLRSERQLCERIDTDLLFRWFLDLHPSDDAFDATTFTHNRKRLDDHQLTQTFFAAVVNEALAANLCSEHFSVDGTIIESFASAKSFQPIPSPSVETPPSTNGGSSREAVNPPATEHGGSPPCDSGLSLEAKEATGTDGSSPSDTGPSPKEGNGFKPRNAEVDFHGAKRTNATHRSRTDPESKLHRKGKGKEAILSHMGHVLNENRNGLIVGIVATEANGTAEREAALDLLDGVKARHGRKPKTVGMDKGYDSGEFFRAVESRGIEPHGPLTGEPREARSAPAKERLKVEARQRMKARQGTEGYRLSQKCRKKVEECFGWLKSIAGLGRSRTVGRWKLQQMLEIGAAAFNLVRLRKLKPA
jgi:transposase